MKLLYKFPIEVFYVPEQFELLNKSFEAFGLGKIGMNGAMGDFELRVESKEGKQLTEEELEEVRDVLHKSLNELVLKYPGTTFKVKPGKLKEE